MRLKSLVCVTFELLDIIFGQLQTVKFTLVIESKLKVQLQFLLSTVFRFVTLVTLHANPVLFVIELV